MPDAIYPAVSAAVAVILSPSRPAEPDCARERPRPSPQKSQRNQPGLGDLCRGAAPSSLCNFAQGESGSSSSFFRAGH